MTRKIGTKAIKVTCAQVLPGHEFNVGKLVRERFKRLFSVNPSGDSYDLTVFKGFGIWDLIIFSEAPSYEATLTKIGPIPGIINSIQFLSFPYMSKGDNEDIFSAIASSPYLGFTLLKMKRLFSREDLDQIEKKLSTGAVKPLILGTIGFNEIVLISLGKEISPILEGIYNLNTLDNDTPAKFFYKSKTQFAIKHDMIIPEEEYPLNSKDLAEILVERNIGLNKPIGNHLAVEISITTKQGRGLACAKYWASANSDYALSAVYGNQDVSVFLDGEKSNIRWAKLISDLLFFRKEYEQDIQSTCTIVRHAFDTNILSGGYVGQWKYSAAALEDIENLSINLMEKLSEYQALTFARQVYALQGYARQDEFKNLFSSMQKACCRYYETIIMRANEKYAAYVSRLIGKGLDLRVYGADPSPPRLSANYYRLAGGVQQAIAALELFPRIAFRKMNLEFSGFVVADEPIYGHYFGALLVPLEDFWFPERWWAIHHEIAHAIDEQVRIFKKDSPVFQNFCTLLHSHLALDTADYLREITAEIIGFLIGFFQDTNAFDSLLWNYLFSIAPLRDQIKLKGAIEYHLQRCFAVHLYQNISAIEKDGRYSMDYFSDSKNLTSDYTKYIYKVVEMGQATAATSSNEINAVVKSLRPELLAAQHVRILSALVPILFDLKNTIDEFNRKYNNCFYTAKESLEDDLTKKIFSTIINGEVYQEQIQHPEAVLFRLVVHHIKNPLTFSQRIAGVLSFSQTAQLMS